MSTEDDARSRLCPACRSDSIPSQSCVACAQARRIDELEQTVERLTARVEELEADNRDGVKKTPEIALTESKPP